MDSVPEMLFATFKAIFLVVAALFPIVNPIGSAAIFINMVGSADVSLQRVLAQKISIYSFFLLICSLLFGAKILLFFGISLYAVQIGGGMVVAATGWSLLNQSGSGAASRTIGPDDMLANAFYPYTLPITVGPGSISVAVTLGANLPSELHSTSFFSPIVLIAAFAGIIITCLTVYFCYSYAGAAEQRLGSSGTSVLMRLFSFILLCIGVQIISNGIKGFLIFLAQRGL